MVAVTQRVLAAEVVQQEAEACTIGLNPRVFLETSRRKAASPILLNFGFEASGV